MEGCGLKPFTGRLDAYLAATTSEARSSIERELFRRHGAVKTVVVTDMSRFSKTVASHGIIHYLALIRQCQKILLPAVQRAGGEVLRCEADNTYSLFEEPDDAVRALVRAQRQIAQHNEQCPLPEDRLGLSAGVGHGRLLLRGHADAFGHEFNLASKLGEDIGSGGDLLLTDAAWRGSSLPRRLIQEKKRRVSGIVVPYVAVKWECVEDF